MLCAAAELQLALLYQQVFPKAWVHIYFAKDKIDPLFPILLILGKFTSIWPKPLNILGNDNSKYLPMSPTDSIQSETALTRQCSASLVTVEFTAFRVRTEPN